MGTPSGESCRKRVLLVSYNFPPKGGVGSQRPLKTAKYLPEYGWDVEVLTVQDPPTATLDPTLLEEVPRSVRVHAAWSVEPTRVVQWLRRRRSQRGARVSASAAGAAAGRGFTGLPRWAVRAVQFFFIPDEKRFWARRAEATGAAVHHDTPVDAVLASGPPFTSLLVGADLSRRLGVPWVADLRDPIVGGYFFVPPTPMHSWLMRRFEKRVLGTASCVVTVTGGIRDGLVSRDVRPADHVLVVPNGFDPEDFAGPAPERDSGVMTFTYVGAFQDHAYPDAFLDALLAARAADEGFARDVRVRFVGPRDSVSERMVEERGLSEVVERTGFVSHRDAVAEMRNADVLFQVMDPVDGLRLALSGKLPEYLAAGAALLSIVPEGAAAEVVRRSEGGVVSDPRDTAALAATLLDLHRKWRAGTLPRPATEVVAEFDRRQLVGKVARALHAAVEDRSCAEEGPAAPCAP